MVINGSSMVVWDALSCEQIIVKQHVLLVVDRSPLDAQHYWLLREGSL